jgi:hypothetical protein
MVLWEYELDEVAVGQGPDSTDSGRIGHQRSQE